MCSVLADMLAFNVLLRLAMPHRPGAKVMANYFETLLHQLAHPGC